MLINDLAAGAGSQSDPQDLVAAKVYLARHGQTAYNLERRFQGQLPVPLDDTGRAQAAELAERAGCLRLRGAVVQPAAARARNRGYRVAARSASRRARTRG